MIVTNIENIIEGQMHYSCRSFDVHKRTYRNSVGGMVVKDTVENPPVAATIPITSTGEVILIKNFRPLIGKWFWETPCGKIELGESPEDAAHRELLEEAGYSAGELKLISEFYTSPGFCTEKIYIYEATELNYVGQDLDEGEEISEVRAFTLKECLQLINSGEIADGQTILTIYHRLLRDRINVIDEVIDKVNN